MIDMMTAFWLCVGCFVAGGMGGVMLMCMLQVNRNSEPPAMGGEDGQFVIPPMKRGFDGSFSVPPVDDGRQTPML